MEIETPIYKDYLYDRRLPDDESKKETVLIQNNPIEEEQ